MTPRFTFRRRLRYAWWFCRRDLCDAVALPVSAAVGGAVALATAAAVVALALPGVTAEVRLRRLAESPWARCVWVSSHPGPRLSDARLRELEGSARARTGDGRADVTAAGFHDVDLWFHFPQERGRVRRNGRTIRPDDPVFAHLKPSLRWGNGFGGPDGAGVILSPRLVERLGGSPDNPPEVVRVSDPKTDRTREWKVVGVTRDALPLDYDFLLTETEERRLRAADGFDPQTAVWSGPIGPDWPKEWDEYPADAQEAAENWGLEVSVRRRAGGHALRLVSRSPRSAEEWRAHMALLAQHVGQKFPARPDFAVVEPEVRTITEPELLGPYPRATLYVGSLKNLRPAADAARAMDLYANDAARAMVDEIEATARRERVLVGWLVFAFCLAEFGTLGLALYLRGRQKAAQIGMLRAMGATAWVLRTLVIAEAVILWAAGTLAGLLAAGLLGWWLRDAGGVTARDLRSAASGGWAATAAAFLLASLAGCVVGNCLATARVRRRPAAESLTLSS